MIDKDEEHYMASPGVYTSETDLSQTLKAFGSTAGGFVGTFNWGPIEVNTIVSSEDDVVEYFGKPDDTNNVDWFSATNFLKYTGSLTIRRVASMNALNASSGVAGMLIKNKMGYDTAESTLSETFYAKYASELGNSISVHVADAATYDAWDYSGEFDTAPGSSDSSSIYGLDINDEMHVVVTDTYGKFSGVPGAILEKFAYLSKAQDGTDTNGQASFYKNVINRKSAYIYVGITFTGADVVDDIVGVTTAAFGDKFTATPYISLDGAVKVQLSNGHNGGIAEKSDYVDGYTIMSNIDDNEVAVIFAGGCGGDMNHADVCNAIGTETKKNQRRVGFFSPKISDVVGVSSDSAAFSNIITTYESITEKHSFVSMATGVKMVYDKYNDAYRWIPTNSDEAGVFARVHNNEGKWVSGAGYNKGVYSNAKGLAYSPNESHRSKLYAKNINCVIQENGAGILLFGDKTLQGKNSTFSFLGTRFLFIELRNIVAEAAKYTLFEFNDEFTQSQFRDLVIPTLRDIKGQRGVHNFLVVCDSTNNTPTVIQNGEFKGDVFIKPNYSIQQVLLSFASVNRTLSFDEVVVKG